jgi:hypothetical protein
MLLASALRRFKTPRPASAPAAEGDADLAQAFQRLLVAAVGRVGGLGGGDQRLGTAQAHYQGDDAGVPVDTTPQLVERRLPASGVERAVQNLDDTARMIREQDAKLAIGEPFGAQHMDAHRILEAHRRVLCRSAHVKYPQCASWRKKG